MRTIGGLILLLALGLFVVVGTNAMSDLTAEANATGDAEIQEAVSGGEHTFAPILSVFGWIVVLLGGMLAVKAFS